MQKDLFTSIGTAILGAIIAFFVCNMFLSPIEPVKFKTVETSVSADVATPSSEVFNYRALNPTVEVYVGDCQEYNELGECIDDETLQSAEGIINNQDSQSNSSTENQ